MRCYYSPPPLHILSKPEEGVTHHSDRPAQPALPEHLCPVRPARENGPVCPPPTLTQGACRRSQRTHSPQLQLALHCSNTSPPPLLTGSSRNEQEKRRVEHLSKDSSSSRREGSGSKDPRNPVSAGSPKGGSHSVSGSQPKS